MRRKYHFCGPLSDHYRYTTTTSYTKNFCCNRKSQEVARSLLLIMASRALLVSVLLGLCAVCWSCTVTIHGLGTWTTWSTSTVTVWCPGGGKCDSWSATSTKGTTYAISADCGSETRFAPPFFFTESPPAFAAYVKFYDHDGSLFNWNRCGDNDWVTSGPRSGTFNSDLQKGTTNSHTLGGTRVTEHIFGAPAGCLCAATYQEVL